MALKQIWRLRNPSPNEGTSTCAIATVSGLLINQTSSNLPPQIARKLFYILFIRLFLLLLSRETFFFLPGCLIVAHTIQYIQPIYLNLFCIIDLILIAAAARFPPDSANLDSP